MTFDKKLVVLHATLSMFGEFLLHAWSWCGGLNAKYCVLVQ